VFVGAGFDNFALSGNFSLWLLHILAFDLVVKWVLFLLFALTMLFNSNLCRLFQTFFRFGVKRSLNFALFFSYFNNFNSLALGLYQFFLAITIFDA